MLRRSTLRPRSPRTLKSYQRLEQEVAQDSGGTIQPRSGGYWARPADLYSPEHLMECKERTARGEGSFTIRREWLDAIGSHASAEGKDPILVFRFRGDRRKWAVLPFEDLMLLARAAFHPYRPTATTPSP